MEDRINSLEDKLDDHIRDHEKTDAKVDQLLAFAAKAQPLVDAWTGAGALGSIIRGIGSIIVAAGAIWVGVTWLVKHAL